MADYFIIGGLFTLWSYNLYRSFNPTLEDLKRNKMLRDNPLHNPIVQSGLYLYKLDKKNIEWEEKCLEAGKILDYDYE